MSTLNKGDIIWAKLRGYPWWPARFVGVRQHKPEPLVQVKFINDNSHASIPLSHVVAYEDKREEYGRTKRKALMRSISCADRLIEGGPRIELEGEGSMESECQTQTKEHNGKRKLIISDSEEEGSERVSMRDAEGLLKEVVSKRNTEVAISLEEKLLSAIKDIKREVTMVTKEIEINLEKFISIYADVPYLKRVRDKANKLLKSLESISTGDTQEVGIASEFPHKLKRLKHTQSIESDSVGEEEIVLVEEDKETPKNLWLMTTVCQELVKLIEEVLVAVIIENSSRRHGGQEGGASHREDAEGKRRQHGAQV
eukprot:TRINITY_DN8536_c0_g2_i1.p1 TRINITY_DN8536_c0_g2~~TRINITY_DN8536_c0_g2_i1.p1  ORF type:complete len:312 (+),score=59.01 TRINITY_DN8536_c0_g2_i1:206-1141(+)